MTPSINAESTRAYARIRFYEKWGLLWQLVVDAQAQHRPSSRPASTLLLQCNSQRRDCSGRPSFTECGVHLEWSPFSVSTGWLLVAVRFHRARWNRNTHKERSATVCRPPSSSSFPLAPCLDTRDKTSNHIFKTHISLSLIIHRHASLNYGLFACRARIRRFVFPRSGT